MTPLDQGPVQPAQNSQNPSTDPFAIAYPDKLRDAEFYLLRKRPKFLPGPRKPDAPDPDRIGFGLSGGGIRSATFCLGLFQGLADLGLLGEIDYISSVSGGSYFAGFYGRLFTRPDIAPVQSGETLSPDITKILSPDEQQRDSFPPVNASRWKRNVFRWLRENGRYLSPRGGGDLLIGIAVMLRNWLTLQLIMWVALLAIFLIAQLLRPLFDHFYLPASDAHFWWSPFVAISGLLALWMVASSGWAYWAFQLPEWGVGDLPPSASQNKAGSRKRWAWLALTLMPVVIVALLAAFRFHSHAPAIAFAAVPFFLMTFIFWWYAEHSPKPITQDPSAPTPTEQNLAAEEAARLWLSAATRNALVATLAVLAFGLIDSVGQTAYAMSAAGNLHPRLWIVPIIGALSAIAPFAQWIAALLRPADVKTRMPSIPLNLLLGIVAALVIVPVLIIIDGFSHAISYDFKIPSKAPACLIAAHQPPVPCEPRLHQVADHDFSDGRANFAVTRVAEVIPDAPSKSQTMSRFISRALDAIRAHAARWASEERPADPLSGPRSPIATIFGLALALSFSAIVGMNGKSPGWIFLNRSSLHALYTARLIRAYLGASNKDRNDDGEGVSDVVPGDDISQARYWSGTGDNYSRGAPLHLLNCTINETIGGRSQLEQRDRKGVGLALGPCGVSSGVRHHVVFKMVSPTSGVRPTEEIYPLSGFKVFDYKANQYAGQQLSLGNWIGVSGAAVSTGMGYRTSLGLSLLLAFFNVRLGFWWNSGIESRSNAPAGSSRHIGKKVNSFLPVQTYLLDEFLGRFYGTSRQRWNLSDGGNFENLGGYELIRRRLPLIVLVDCGADPDYKFEDLSNLVRKARLDFNAEIKFFSTEELRQLHLDDTVLESYGTLDELRRGRWTDEPLPSPAGSRNVRFKSGNMSRHSLKHAALAGIYYLDSPKYDLAGKLSHNSLLILIKPTLTGDESADVLEYHNSHPSFPHE